MQTGVAAALSGSSTENLGVPTWLGDCRFESLCIRMMQPVLNIPSDETGYSLMRVHLLEV